MTNSFSARRDRRQHSLSEAVQIPHSQNRDPFWPPFWDSLQDPIQPIRKVGFRWLQQLAADHNFSPSHLTTSPKLNFLTKRYHYLYQHTHLTRRDVGTGKSRSITEECGYQLTNQQNRPLVLFQEGTDSGPTNMPWYWHATPSWVARVRIRPLGPNNNSKLAYS